MKIPIDNDDDEECAVDGARARANCIRPSFPSPPLLLLLLLLVHLLNENDGMCVCVCVCVMCVWHHYHMILLLLPWCHGSGDDDDGGLRKVLPGGARAPVSFDRSFPSVPSPLFVHAND